MPLIGPKPKPGDLIEFHYTLYQHWGVYVGEGYVVHLTDVNGLSRLSEGTATVKKERLETVAKGCNYEVNNKYDRKSSPYPPEEIVKMALGEVGKKMHYNVHSANCEHFATNLRCGKKYSDQVKKAKGYAAGGTIFFAIFAVFAMIVLRIR